MDLVTEIERFIVEHEMSATAFGMEALNDPAFVSQLRAGRDIKLSTMARVQAFMANRPPQDAAA